MALQDGLLSFAIKETIFLSSDKTGIDEWRELELFPDVEVLETDSSISITGCLQLFGKYKPIKDTSESTGGGTETLVEAVTFSPFRPGGPDGHLYDQEEQLHHRIPLNITIPLNRIAEIEDIYAVVDSFDYQLDSPRQVMIEADLKIAGIKLTETNYQKGQPENDPEEASYGEISSREEWQFNHVSQNQSEELIQPISLEDIERKLAELESEMHRQLPLEETQQAQAAEHSPKGFTAMFEAPRPSLALSQAESDSVGFGDVTEVLRMREQENVSDSKDSYSFKPVSWKEPEENPELYEGMAPGKTFGSQDERPLQGQAPAPSWEQRKAAESQSIEAVRAQPERAPEEKSSALSREPQEVTEAQPTEVVRIHAERHKEMKSPASSRELREVSASQPVEAARSQAEKPAEDQFPTVPGEVREVSEPQSVEAARSQAEKPAEDQSPTVPGELREVSEPQLVEAARPQAEKPAEDKSPAVPGELRGVSEPQSVEAARPAEEKQEESVVASVSADSKDVAEAETTVVDTDDASVETIAEETAANHDQEAAEVSAEAPSEAVEEKEVRVAISGKPAREEGGKVNLTSIFSQATRAQQEARIEEESSSQASRKGSFEADSASIKTMHNLTSFVRSKEEKQSRLKLCIIQRDETLETICQRYAIPQSRILEVNNLRSDQIVAGQILYIPQ
ncbi:LysM peptidoglycan-binding domain-containing protein [Brevibacillus borstelensis]|uniref:LysM peptidoglycan-binding domain-containing protein n=1 Tax=Brevibacillus borstelensis TaxID=45462 RepID=UPI0030C47E01